MKKCTLCGDSKDFSEFNRKSTSLDGFQNKCRECSRLFSKQHYRDNVAAERIRLKKRQMELKKLFEDYRKTTKCFLCGENESCCLDFHHNEPTEKDFSVSLASRMGFSWEKTLAEIYKCTVLCSNCHRKVHAGVVQLNIGLVA